MRRFAAALTAALTLAACTTATDDPATQDRRPRAENREPTDKEPRDRPTKAERRVKLWPVVRVVDGDTVEVHYKGRVQPIRVIGIDTPETVHPTEPVECWGLRASAQASKLLGGERVQVLFDPSQGRRDAYDRLLAYLVIPDIGDFGEAMIRRGHAAEYTYDTAYANQQSYQRAEAKAKLAKLGLWKACGGVDTPLETSGPPQPTKPSAGGDDCADGYSPCVPPYPPDVSCDDVNGPITVTGSDPHRLDADGDGTACE